MIEYIKLFTRLTTSKNDKILDREASTHLFSNLYYHYPMPDMRCNR